MEELRPPMTKSNCSNRAASGAVSLRKRDDAQPEWCRLAAPLPGAVAFPEMKTKKTHFLNPFGRHRYDAEWLPTLFSMQIRAAKQ